MAVHADIQTALNKREGQRRRQVFTRSLIYHLFVGGFGLFMLYPILWMVSSSLKPPTEIWTTVNNLIPSTMVLENYVDGWSGFGGITFTTFYKNTIFYTVVGTLFQVAASTIVAYGFARIKFRGKQIWFTIMLLTLMLPNEVELVPQYIIFSRLGWVPGFLPLLIPRLGGSAFFIFMIMQFIRSIPMDMDEAAMIDGADQFGIYRHVILPQLKPAIITAAIFSFYWTWEDFLGPLLYLTKPEMYTVSIALRNYADATAATNWGAIFAMLSLSLLPVFLIFIFFQRYIVEGISTTGLK
ncbi:MAG: carbohydrate ABC transporter permease [Anaerolineae bacterium]|nr:carbohydrate ABC transporter permease [Anaerolineae bacterium]